MDDMQGQMMVSKDTMMNMMNQHHYWMYTFGILVLVGLVILIVLQCKILKALHRK